MTDTLLMEVTRGHSVLTADGVQGPGTILAFDPAEAASLMASGFLKYPDAPQPAPAATVQMNNASPDGTGVLLQAQSWEQQRQAAEAEKAAKAVAI